jgi:hypothetical protein
LSANIVQLKLPSKDGKLYETDVANMTTVLRIIQSIQSSNAEPFKGWLALKKQLVDQEGFSELFGNSEKLKLPSSDGKMRETGTINTKTLLRIVQSIPSKNAEPFKNWIAPEEATR